MPIGNFLAELYGVNSRAWGLTLETAAINPALRPITNTVKEISKNMGVLPDHQIQNVRLWLPKAGSPQYEAYKAQIRETMHATDRLPVVVLKTSRISLPDGRMGWQALANDLNRGFAVGTRAGDTMIQTEFAKHFHLWIRQLLSDALDQRFTSHSHPAGSTVVQRMGGGRMLAPDKHLDGSVAFAAAWSFGDEPTLYEDAEHYLGRRGRLVEPDTMHPAPGFEAGDIIIHPGSRSIDGLQGVYHGTPTSGRPRTVAVTLVTLPGFERQALDEQVRAIARRTGQSADLARRLMEP
jgi:hypothetical protein